MVVELKLGPRRLDLPFSVRVPGVTEAMFGELVDADTKAELLDGVMIVHSPASPRHDDVGGFLRPLMRSFAEETEQGRVLGPDSLIHLATCRIFAPDIFFLTKKRLPRRLPRKQFEGAPDWIVEILSPWNRSHDLEDKRYAYRDAEVKEIWFVDPEGQEVIVDRQHRRGYATLTVTDGRVESAVLRGFWVEAAWLWADPLPGLFGCQRAIIESAS
jgi:Uma2 family endonuclease